MGPQVVRALLAVALLGGPCAAGAQPCSALVTWTWPTANSDGTAYSNPDGGKVYWGLQQGNYPSSARITAGQAPSRCVTGLGDGLWFFQASAINTAGNESMLSNVAMKNVLAAPPTPPRPTAFTMTPRAPAVWQIVLSTRLAYIGDAFDLSVGAVPGATRYEWEVQQFENKITNAASGQAIVWTASRSGHVTPRVRACNAVGCSAWFASTDLGWWAHFWIRPPSF